MTVQVSSDDRVIFDQTMDYAPICSTATNLFALFVKCAVIPCTSQASIDNSRYYTHIQNKSFFRCVTLLIPFLGNGIVVAYDIAVLLSRGFTQISLFTSSAASSGRFLDYVPYLGTAKNIMDIFLKCTLVPLMSKETIQTHPYYTHLADKSLARCFVLLVPIFGNISVALYDLSQAKTNALTLVKQDGLALQSVGYFQNDQDVVKKAVRQNGLALQFASPPLKDREAIVLTAMSQNLEAAQFGSSRTLGAIRDHVAALLEAS